jgi:hypothetical protein
VSFSSLAHMISILSILNTLTDELASYIGAKAEISRILTGLEVIDLQIPVCKYSNLALVLSCR